MARTQEDPAKLRAEVKRLTKLAEKNGWTSDDDEESSEPIYRVHFIDGTLDQLRSMGLSFSEIISDGEGDDQETGTQDAPAEAPEVEEPAEEPKPRNRSRYFGGR